MTDTDRYLRALAYQLRWRRLPEADVERALRQVAEESRRSTRSPEQVFGPVEQYASSFTRGNSVHPGRTTATTATTAVLFAAAVVGIASFAELILNANVFSLWTFLLLILGALAWSFAAILFGAAIDRRLPRDWARG